MKFRKIPVVIEAFKLSQSCRLWPQWAVDALTRNEIITHNMGAWVNGPEYHADIVTLEGTMRANPGDYIIRGVKGEIYPCKPDIFEATYEEVV